jgi:hypothetical protein
MGLRALKRGYLAKYDDGRAFIVEEESADAASGVLAELAKRMSEPTKPRAGDEAIAGKDRYLGQMFVARKGSRLVGFATRAADTDLAARVSAILENLK